MNDAGEAKLWTTRPPTVEQLTRHIRAGAPEYVRRVWEVIHTGLLWFFENLPPQAKISLPAGYAFSKEQLNPKYVDMAMQHVIRDSNLFDSPYALANRILSAFHVYYGQCPKKQHQLIFHASNGKQPAYEISTEVLDKLGKLTGIHGHFRKQLYLCEDHRFAVCQFCKSGYDMLQHKAKFWSTKLPGCEKCLRHFLMFVEKNHSTKPNIIKIKNGQRALYKKTVWTLGEQLTVPVGKSMPLPGDSISTTLTNVHATLYNSVFNPAVINTAGPTEELSSWLNDPGILDDPSDE